MPAMIFNFCLTIITLHATRTMESGYQQFSKDLTSLFAKITESQSFQLYYSIKYVYISLSDMRIKIRRNNYFSSLRTCVILQDFVTLYNIDEHDVCSIFYALEVGTCHKVNHRTRTCVSIYILIFLRPCHG